MNPRTRRSAEPATQALLGFEEVLGFIRQSRSRALTAVNAELVGLYRQIGEYLSDKIKSDGWGEGTVQELSAWLQSREPGIRGFSPQNLWRMRQFFEVFKEDEELSTVSRELSWSHNLAILGKCKSRDERAFYMKLAISNRWPFRELERQIRAGLFERNLLGKPKLSTALRELHPLAESFFKDRYVVDFVDLPEPHSEGDLQKALVKHLKTFLLELGRDFCFIGDEYQLQVGGRDFYIDLLFFHRGLQALVAIELKIGDFEPEYLGKLAFYLEALDRDHRRAHESPSIGVLLCKSRDADVVEFSLSRTLSPALVAEYETRLPDKRLLMTKLDEFYEQVRLDQDSQQERDGLDPEGP